MYNDAVRCAEIGLSESDKLSDVTKKPLFMNIIGRVSFINGDSNKAVQNYNQVYELAQKNNDLRYQGISCLNKGIILYTQGNYDGSLEDFEKALDIFEKINDQTMKSNTINNIANQNRGTEYPKKTNIDINLSNIVFRFKAEYIPIGKAIQKIIINATEFSSNVAGNLSNIFFITGRLSLNDLPKSNLTNRLSQLRYCTYQGLSNPYNSCNL